ncbi:MAG: 3-phosphoglycerate dehydrogenase, partial [Eubacteriaceae bacterium]|nr:3-phosphoglycerate dehydrogenase [Eubacteriaceae bacterium]
MYKIKIFNKIDPQGLDRLPKNFELTEDSDYDGIILRSYKMSEAELTTRLAAVARAGAGVNNIPVDSYAQKGVVVFNTPGANANAVKEIVLLGALLASRKVYQGIAWAQGLPADDAIEKAVEAGKADFVGPEILGKKVGVIGLGSVGVLVANLFEALGAVVYGYDPFISIKNAWGLSSQVSRTSSVEWIFENCDRSE